MSKSSACCWKEAVAARPTIAKSRPSNSVYFDDAGLSTCQANLDGLGRRNKVRIRWYDTPQPGHSFFFEIKSRDQPRYRSASPLPDAQAGERLSELSYDTILASLAAALPEDMQPALVRYCERSVLVRYRRGHFTAADGSLRTTIDYDIAYFDQTGKRFISTSFGVPVTRVWWC